MFNLRSLLGYSDPVGYTSQTGVPDMGMYGSYDSEAPSDFRSAVTRTRRKLGGDYSRRPTTFPPVPDETFTVAGGVRG